MNIHGRQLSIIAIVLPVLLLAMAAPARSQNPDDLYVRVGGMVSDTDGGDKNEGVWHLLALTFGKSFVGRWSMRDCGYFTLSSLDDKFEDAATVGWRVEITPLRVRDRAVSFRLRWVRALDNSKEWTPPREDVELTLRPGETRTIDRIAVPPGAKTMDDKPCKTTAALLQVSVGYSPWEDADPRLVTADLWLIERLPNGAERSLPVSIRAVPNRASPFYFDSIVEGSSALDIFGEVTARVEKDGLEIALETRSRNRMNTPPSGSSGPSWPTQWLQSVVHLKPQEIVEVALPKLGRGGGPFGDRVFPIRIRARQLR